MRSMASALGITKLKITNVEDKRDGLRNPRNEKLPTRDTDNKIFPVNPPFKKLGPKSNGPWRVVKSKAAGVPQIRHRRHEGTRQPRWNDEDNK